MANKIYVTHDELSTLEQRSEATETRLEETESQMTALDTAQANIKSTLTAVQSSLQQTRDTFQSHVDKAITIKKFGKTDTSGVGIDVAAVSVRLATEQGLIKIQKQNDTRFENIENAMHQSPHFMFEG